MDAQETSPEISNPEAAKEVPVKDKEPGSDFTPARDNADGLIWSSIVDKIQVEQPGVIVTAPTAYSHSPEDEREIVEINGTPLDIPVPVDFFNLRDLSDQANLVRETVLDIHAVLNDNVRYSAEQLSVSLQDDGEDSDW